MATQSMCTMAPTTGSVLRKSSMQATMLIFTTTTVPLRLWQRGLPLILLAQLTHQKQKKGLLLLAVEQEMAGHAHLVALALP